MDCTHRGTDAQTGGGAIAHCSITPPDLLARLAGSDDPDLREAAIQTLAASASMRTQRSLVTRVMREMDVDAQALGLAPPPTGQRQTVYDNENQGRDNLPGRKVRAQGEPPAEDDAVNEAYDGAEATYDFYKEVLERDSIDGAGLEIVSSVHYGVNYDNAFWNGVQMAYGDGSGRVFVRGGLTKAIDVIGHEITHGVVQYTAGLEYASQPGALNESFADVLGTLVKQFALGQSADEADWLLGDGILVPELGTALRSMKEPGTAFEGDRQPGHMDDYVDLPADNDPRNDNGGVHINSGIPNRAFHLAAMAIGGNAWEKAGRIWYASLVERLERDSEFTDAARATVEVAGELYESGGPEQEAVESAWRQVGVLS
jgi:Zn-dependent metalloprotease